MSKINRLGSRLPPKRNGASVIHRVWVSWAGDSDVVVADVNHFGFAGWSFEERFHRIADLV
jgi:hypothetical protein